VNLTGSVIHTGWKAIARRLGVKDIRTAKNLVRKNHVPVYRLGKSPLLDEAVYLVWVEEIVRLSRRKMEEKHDG
jgi:hypothetical protein